MPIAPAAAVGNDFFFEKKKEEGETNRNLHTNWDVDTVPPLTYGQRTTNRQTGPHDLVELIRFNVDRGSAS